MGQIIRKGFRMPDKPDLFQKLFRKTKENLEKKPQPTPPQPAPSQPAKKPVIGAPAQTGGAPAARPGGATSAPAKPAPPAGKPPTEPKKIKVPLTGGKLEAYRSCPRKFSFAYLEKAASSRGPSHYLSFDSSLHAALKLFYRTRKPNEPLKLENLLKFYASSWDSRGYDNPEHEKEVRAEGEKALANYFEKFCKGPPKAAEVDYFFKVELFGGEYSGKIDRVDKFPDGTLEFIDYKSGKPPEGGVDELAGSLPVQLLFHVADILWPGKAKKLSCIYLKSGTMLTVFRNPARMASAKKEFLELADRIYAGDFSPKRSEGCEFCDFRELCPVGRIPTLNATKLRAFLDCPRKYELTYVSRAGKKPFEGFSPDLLLDRLLHDALKTLHQKSMARAGKEPLPLALEAFYASIPGELPEEQAFQLKESGRELLVSYVQKFFPQARVKALNQPINLTRPNFDFQATMDRVDDLPDGTLELIDYKTGKRVSEEDELKTDPVVLATAASAYHQHGGKVSRFSCIFLRGGMKVSIPVDEFLVNRGMNLLEDVATRILRGDFEALGGTSCSFCRVSDHCGSGQASVSISKIQTLRECPKRFKFRYIDRAEVPDREKPSLVLYQALRDSLRNFVSQGKMTPVEPLVEFFGRKLGGAGLTDPAVVSKLAESGTTALRNFHASLGGKFPSVKSMCESVRAGFEGVVLNSSFDRVDLLPNGKLDLVIYKTAKKMPSPHEVGLDISGIFNFVTGNTAWNGKVEKVTYHYLLANQKVFFTPSDREIERLRLALAEFQDELARGEFEGQRNPLCSYCDYVEICDDAKRMLLSPSKINTFLSCAYKYKMNYIDRVPKEVRPTPHLNFDRSIHYALREFHEQYDVKSLTKNPFPQILGKFWINAGYADWEDEQRFKTRAAAFLESYFQGLDGSENPVFFETGARWRLDNLDLAVNFDRVDELPNGKLEVIDYKTGKKILDERVVHDDMGLMNMFMAANNRWPGRVEKVTYHFMAGPKKVSLTPTGEDIQKHTERILKLAGNIESAEFEANKGCLCAWCEFYGPCPQWKIKPFQLSNETQEVFRKRIRLSYSKMGLFENCPRSYRKLYIDRIPPKPQPFFSFGTTIHETFEHIYDPSHPRPRPSLEELLEVFESVRMTLREGYSTPEIEERYRQDGIRQLTLYYHRFIENKDFQPAHSIEDYFEIPCGKYAVMTGFIDRIDKLPDGTFEILDYKTEPTDRTQAEVDKDKQLSIYYWACEDSMDLKISKLSLFMLDHDKKIETTRKRADIQKVVEHVDETAYRMINEKEFLPKKNKYCKSCDHLHDCPLKDEVMADQSLISMKKF